MVRRIKNINKAYSNCKTAALAASKHNFVVKHVRQGFRSVHQIKLKTFNAT